MKLWWIACALAAAGGCKGTSKDSGSAASGSGSAVAMGSAETGSGSATTGSGSAETGSGSAETGSGSAATGSGSGSGSATVMRPPDWTDMRTIKVEGPTPRELEMAKDVLPAEEVAELARVAVGDGYRFQLPNVVSAVVIDGVKGFGGIDDVTIPATPQFHWATVSEHAGDMAEAVARQKAIVQSMGGTISGEMKGPVWIAGKRVEDGAFRFTAAYEDRTELAALVVHGGKRYVLHCAAPTIEKAWVHSSQPCEHFAKTFHVGAPPLKKRK